MRSEDGLVKPLTEPHADIEALVMSPGPPVTRKTMMPLPCGCVVETTAARCPHYKIEHRSLPEETP